MRNLNMSRVHPTITNSFLSIDKHGTNKDICSLFSWNNSVFDHIHTILACIRFLLSFVNTILLAVSKGRIFFNRQPNHFSCIYEYCVFAMFDVDLRWNYTSIKWFMYDQARQYYLSFLLSR
jgi:hypothetical protein